MSEKNPFSHFADALKKVVGARPAEKPTSENLAPAEPLPPRDRRESPGRLSPSRPDDVGFVDEWKLVDGERYRKFDTGYTIAEYYNHPGPGWDFRWPVMEQYGVWDPLELPDDKCYYWYEDKDIDK